MRIHFDGDIVVYRAGFAAEKARYYIPDGEGEFKYFENKKSANDYCESQGIDQRVIEQQRELEPVENALYNAKTMVEKTKEILRSDDLVMHLSGDTNFREGIATLRPYKGNRDPSHKPVHGPAIKEYLENKYPTVWSVDEEADDVVAYSHYAMYLKDPDSTIIASTDKDLDMVPGWHYNFVKDIKYFMPESEAMHCFYTQLLKGDTTDNIPGVPGIGAKKAEWAYEGAQVETEEEYYAVALALYIQGYGEDNAKEALIENARLLWMRLEPNQWWNPPGERDG